MKADNRKVHFQDPVRFTQRTEVVGGEFRIAKSYCGGKERKTTISLRDVTCLNCILKAEYHIKIAREVIAKRKEPYVEPNLFGSEI